MLHNLIALIHRNIYQKSMIPDLPTKVPGRNREGNRNGAPHWMMARF